MKNVDALFILCWRTTANQYSFYLSTCTPKHETLKNCSTSFFIKSCDLFLFLFSQFFYQFYIHMYMKPSPIHSPTHPLSRKKKLSRSRTELAMPGVPPTGASQISIRYYCSRELHPSSSTHWPHCCRSARPPKQGPWLMN